jgi:uncharacterized phage protein gp47/JayE
MTISPDYTQYIDLTLYDKSPSDIFAAAVATLQSRVTDWVPDATNIEVVLMEALAVEIGELQFAINRIPKNMIYVLLNRYGVTRDPGSAPAVELTFTMQDDYGYVIPAGTEVAISLSTSDYVSSNEYMTFYTNSDLVVAQPNTTGIVTASSRDYTDVANGIEAGAAVEVVAAIDGVESVVTSSEVYGGSKPETDEAFAIRGSQRLQRLVDTLVIPDHFTLAALETGYVSRATTIDNWDASVAESSPGDHPGSVTVVVYGEGAFLSAPMKANLASSLEASAATNLTVTVIDPVLTEVDVTVEVTALPGYASAGVIEAVTTRLNEYLSVYNWPWAGTVRRNDLISVIDQVPGVDFVASLTVPSTDVVLSGSGNVLVAPGDFDVSIDGEATVSLSATAGLTEGTPG